MSFLQRFPRFCKSSDTRGEVKLKLAAHCAGNVENWKQDGGLSVQLLDLKDHMLSVHGKLATLEIANSHLSSARLVVQ